MARKGGEISMRPRIWRPPIEPSPEERKEMRLIKRAKLFVFLRENRHEIFDESFQEELSAIHHDSRLGQPPIPPARLALATILQAYTSVSDDEAMEAMVMDRRWQLVLDCLGADEPPFSKWSLVNFPKRLIERELDRRLIERTVAVAKRRGGFSGGRLRAALDSSPLWGAGRVEDTYNLLGHALKKALGVIACRQGRGLAEVANEAGAGMLAGGSLKAALDCDWDDPDQRAVALSRVLGALEAVEEYLQSGALFESAEVCANIETARRVREQDVEEDADGSPALRRGVARERRISVEDPQMRHGRKSRSVRFDGYKRHVLNDLDSGLVRAVGITRANAPEATVTEAISRDLRSQGAWLSELHIDRAYLSSELVRERSEDLEVYCKAWALTNAGRYPKTAFELDWDRGRISCPAGVETDFEVGGVVRFPKRRARHAP
jgi:Transposase domain (DUF772)